MSVEEPISEGILDRFRDFLAESMGIFFPRDQRQSMVKKVKPIVTALGGDGDPEGCLETLMTVPMTPEIMGTLAHHLTIGETYFFRDPAMFRTLREEILPGIIKRKAGSKQIRIWCAGCATGEEPYSVAILLHQLIRDIETWKVTILGTDLNRKFLHRAEAARYKKWSFRAIPEAVKDRYFRECEEGLWELSPEIRDLVEFRYLNLVTGDYPSITSNLHEMDMVFCNNVLIYFGARQIEHTVRKLVATLAEGGWLCVTPIEVPYIVDDHLSSQMFGNVLLFKKDSSALHDVPSAPVKVISVPPETADYIPYFTPIEPVANTVPPQHSQEITHVDDIVQAFDQGKYKDVVEVLERELAPIMDDGVQLRSRQKDATLLFRAYANLGRLDPALMWCEKVISLNQADPILHCLHATILQEKGRLEDATKSLRRALYLDDNSIPAHFALGCISLSQGKEKEADRCFRNALQLLEKFPREEIIPGTEGLPAGSLVDIIKSRKIPA